MPRLRVQIGGVMAVQGAWSNTLEFALDAAVPSLTVLQTIATAIQTTLASSTPFRSAFGTDTDARNPKLLYYPTGSTTATLVATGAGAAIPGTSTSVHAPQVCIVASLRTDFSGRSARGRLYCPYRGSQINAAGAVSGPAVVVVAGYANAIKSAVVAACAAQGIAAAWGVYSPKTQVMRTITSILVGSQCDTIRHRNDNRAETYTASAVTATQVQSQSIDDDDLLARIAASATAVPFNQALQDAPGFLQSVIDVIPFPDGPSAREQADDEQDAAASVAAQSIELDDQGDDQS